MKWTDEQWQAITADNDTVLVSAAAGSGKTAVLVERVVRLIREGGDISRMLIVTFTRAAAAEMRERITAALEKETGDAHLTRQALRVGTAQISTIHTFCQRVIHEHFEVLGMDPMAQIGDETRIQRLLSRAYAEGLEAVCADPTEEEALLLACYSLDEIAEMIEKLRAFLLSLPDPWGWAEEALRDGPPDIREWPAYQTLERVTRLRLSAAEPLLRNCFDCLLTPGTPGRYEDTVRQDEALLSQLQAAARDGTLRGGKVRFSTLPRAKKGSLEEEDPAAVEAFKKARDDLKKAVQEALSLLPEDEEAAREEDLRARAAARGLYQALRQVQDRYDRLKNDKNLLDYSDLEHFCVRALGNEDVRKAVAAEYDTLFIDEYQDVSAIQESIIRSIHENNTLFLVGDVKQSIYSFRQADPSLFLHKYDTFSLEPEAKERKILLQNNFRSARNVLDCVNLVFQRTMRRDVTEIDYDEAAMLRPGPDALEGPPMEIHLLEKKDPETGEPVRLAASSGAEAEAVARHIGRLMKEQTVHDRDGRERPVRFRDIVILMRNAAGYAAHFASVLQAHGIPVYSDTDSQYYDLPEISDTLNLLRVIDNPYQDIPLLAALRCPCFRFSEEELARVRLVNNQSRVPFHQVFLEMAEKGDELGQRCQRFLDTLERWRTLAEVTRVEDLIRLILDETGIYTRAGTADDGDARQANLRLLAEKGAQSETISDFLTQAQKGAGPDDSKTAKTLSDQEDVVRIMTMHKSKGLEFPVVILAGLSRTFRPVSAEKVKADPKLGIGLPMIDPERRTRTQTVTELAVGAAMENRRRAEEARVLYVAMTRAREKLILYGAPALIGQSENNWRLPAGGAAVLGANCMMDWVMQAALPALDKGNGELYEAENGALLTVSRDDVTDMLAQTPKEERLLPVPEPGPYSETTALLLSREMPEARPYKVSVSAIAKRPVTQEDEEETPRTKRNVSRETLPDRPRFLQEKQRTAAERGTLIHQALGLIDYEALRGEGCGPEQIARQLDRLAEESKLTREERAELRPEDIAGFFGTDLGQRALRSELARREWSFNLQTEDNTVVQGVLDLCFLEDGAWVLVDYKTDRVGSVQELAPRYEKQLGWYARALTHLTGKPVREAALYSVRLQDSVTVSVSL